jgi:hypothetical protein
MSVLTKMAANVIFIKMAILEHFGEDAHGRDGHGRASKSYETL